MNEFDKIGEDLFNKLRGRFSEITIGDNEGIVTNEPAEARFFDFDYNGLGKVSASLDEEEGLTVIYSKDFMENQDEMTQDAWYDFLKELRVFAKKRMLDYNVRDITKSNLTKRDYKFLAKRPGDGTMTESKLYGTSRVSYQKVGEARIVIQHTENINQESATGRTQKIGKIYIESADGERFRYPYKHLTGARAMARHVAEGGNAYDDFGKHIVGLSEEMAKLRKFKNYMGRSAVMAESLTGYVDIVKERIATVKKEIASLQKPAYYKETFESFNPPVLEDVPSDVRENWIDELTIKQFNEELADVFPYIYKLVSEATKAKELGPDDLVDEGERHGNSKIYDKCRDGWKKKPGATRGSKGSCIPEEIALEQGFEEMMGQFAEGNDDNTDEDNVQEAYIKTRKDAVEALGRLRGIGKKIETGKDTYDGNLANEYVSDVYDVINWMDANLGISGMNDPKLKQVLDPVVELRKEAKGMETKPGSGKDARFGNKIVNTLYPLMVYIEDHMEEPKDEGNAFSGAVAQAKKDGKKKGDKVQGPDGDEITLEKDDKTPLGEFILSYYDRETGQFPKGETAVLTMIEKDYGEQFIESAKAFIEQINALYDEHQMRTQPQQMEVDTEYDRMRELAGLR